MLDSCSLKSVYLRESKTSEVAVIIKVMIKVVYLVIGFRKFLKPVLLPPEQILNGLSGTG